MKKNRIPAILIIILGSITFWFVLNKKNSTIKKELSDFAVEDTAAITKIFLADNDKRTVLLERTGESWMLNGKYQARQDAMDVLLTTIKRVAVKTPVPKSAFENIIKQIASENVKIEIYKGGEEPVKVYYVGSPNQDHDGTYMLLENSSVPFLMHIEGFRGFLTPRYFVNENDWRSTALFHYGFGEISSVKLEYPLQPENSFLITDLGNNKFSLKSLKNNLEITDYDTVSLLQYLSLYQKINFEGFEETKTEQYKDSILKTPVQQIFTVKDKTGNVKTLTTFLKPAQYGAMDLERKAIKYDSERLYGLIDNKEFVVIQFFVFDPLTKTLNDFKKKNRSAL